MLDPNPVDPPGDDADEDATTRRPTRSGRAVPVGDPRSRQQRRLPAPDHRQAGERQPPTPACGRWCTVKTQSGYVPDSIKSWKTLEAAIDASKVYISPHAEGHQLSGHRGSHLGRPLVHAVPPGAPRPPGRGRPAAARRAVVPHQARLLLPGQRPADDRRPGRPGRRATPATSTCSRLRRSKPRPRHLRRHPLLGGRRHEPGRAWSRRWSTSCTSPAAPSPSCAAPPPTRTSATVPTT